jgi:hypothetical protein
LNNVASFGGNDDSFGRMANRDRLSPQIRIVALLDRRLESVHVDLNDLPNSLVVHRWRLIVY